VLNKPLLDFVRATASFLDGSCTIGMERSFFGYSISLKSSYRLETAAGRLRRQTSEAGSAGPVHPVIMKFGDIHFCRLVVRARPGTQVVGKWRPEFSRRRRHHHTADSLKKGREPTIGLAGQPTNSVRF